VKEQKKSIERSKYKPCN